MEIKLRLWTETKIRNWRNLMQDNPLALKKWRAETSESDTDEVFRDIRASIFSTEEHAALLDSELGEINKRLGFTFYLDKFSSIGGYPIIYLDKLDNILCNECATLEQGKGGEAVGNINHGYEENCNECNALVQGTEEHI